MRLSTNYFYLVAARECEVTLQKVAKGPYVLETNDLRICHLECLLHLGHFFLKYRLIIFLFLGGKIAIHLNFPIHFYYNFAKYHN